MVAKKISLRLLILSALVVGPTVSQEGFTAVTEVFDDEEPVFINSTELSRDLQQTTGTGVSGDICQAGGGRFTCQTSTELTTSDGNTSRLDMNFNCFLDSFIGMDFRRADDCQCSVHISEVNRTTRVCGCVGCPVGYKQPVAFNCSTNEEDPYIVGTCVSLDCNGNCNGTIGFANVDADLSAFEQDTGTDATGSGGTDRGIDPDAAAAGEDTKDSGYHPNWFLSIFAAAITAIYFNF